MKRNHTANREIGTRHFQHAGSAKTKTNLEIPLNLDSKEVETLVLADENVQKYLAGQTPKKVIVVKGRIVNMVV
ncbi:MAG: hypothetical protein EOP42_15265 [Sphingobacteriaceae bacterium]|nr:MAG: hypothetical protein EOP42_15265 [Sphingobacteriaceae bacterium]